jgi:hypothetical protein
MARKGLVPSNMNNWGTAALAPSLYHSMLAVCAVRHSNEHTTQRSYYTARPAYRTCEVATQFRFNGLSPLPYAPKLVKPNF